MNDRGGALAAMRSFILDMVLQRLPRRTPLSARFTGPGCRAFRNQIIKQQREAGVRVIGPPHALGFLDRDLPREHKGAYGHKRNRRSCSPKRLRGSVRWQSAQATARATALMSVSWRATDRVDEQLASSPPRRGVEIKAAMRLPRLPRGALSANKTCSGGAKFFRHPKSGGKNEPERGQFIS